ncbi:hypothetical protein M9979_11150 [Sphingomonas sp. RP10(2022)]|uniref:Uncharacterized protein n=1 Tax=Sphingomonas liriopis TaxID=2949094 RepID=A0A9X2HWF4_9SPHN|nr:hypothetical protein [Sphingomonas liriopis]MCP3735426.1 hypothetical protein [Sphingomonas liriopis]
MALSNHAYSRIAQKVQAPSSLARTPWSPPPLTELVARIDAALIARRAS